MSHHIEPGDLAVVIPGLGGANNVRKAPDRAAIAEGQIPENAVLVILPKPGHWTEDYPYDDGRYVWYYVRGRIDEQNATGRFDIVQGWTVTSERGNAYVRRMEATHACSGTLHTHLQVGQHGYVLPSDGLNVRKDADPDSAIVNGLLPGTTVDISGGPQCAANMVWWHVTPIGPAGRSGWASEGDSSERFIMPLTLK